MPAGHRSLPQTPGVGDPDDGFAWAGDGLGHLTLDEVSVGDLPGFHGVIGSTLRPRYAGNASIELMIGPDQLSWPYAIA